MCLKKAEPYRLLNVLAIVLVSLLLPLCQGEDYLSQEKERMLLQYSWAAKALDVFSIYRDRLPPDLYAFSTPQELYRYIGDNYTYFLDESYTRIILRDYLSTNESGIGIRFDSTGAGFIIKYVFPDAPGEIAGLRKFDLMLQIDGVNLQGESNEEVYSHLLGVSGTSVEITIKRESQTLPIRVTRGEYKSPTVFFDSVNSTTAYIKLEAFLNETNISGGSAREFRNALQATSWADYTIFDLRNNPGGMINQCIDILGELVPAETKIMITSEREYDQQTGSGYTMDSVYVTKGSGSAVTRNIVILADSLSASASEMLISCMKLNRPDVKIIGDTTYGKAIGQVLLVKEHDSVMVSITSLIITRTDGTSYNKTGIAPDIAVKSDEADEKALSFIAEETGLAKTKDGNSIFGGYSSKRVWKPLFIKSIQEF